MTIEVYGGDSPENIITFEYQLSVAHVSALQKHGFSVRKVYGLRQAREVESSNLV